MLVSRTLGLLLAIAATLTAAAPAAQACACCTHEGQRYDGIAQLDSGKREEIQRLRFSTDAELFLAERDPTDVEGITTPSARYKLRVSQDEDRWIFAFRDKAGNSGSLTLTLPTTVSIFAVDPRRGERKGGTGPALYREWKLTSRAAGTGIFTPGMASNQRITLILHGHGNNCTGPDMATHWTLMVSGPKAHYHFFGKFVQ